MIDFLVIVLVFVALFQPTQERALAAICFASLTLVHNLLSDYFSDINYYFSDMFLHLWIIFTLVALSEITDFILILIRICIGAIVLNIFGWVIYMLYLSPIYYNYAFASLYIYTIYIMSGKDKSYGNIAMGRRGVDLDSHNSESNSSLPRSETQT